MVHPTHVRSVIASLVVTFSAWFADSAGAQTWVPVTPNSPPGSPASVVFNAGVSDLNHSVFDVLIRGFWRTTVLAPDGLKYQRIEVPGLDHYGQEGAPDLGIARLRMAVMTQFPDIRLLSVVPQNTVVFPGLRVYPLPKPGSDEVQDPNADPGPGDPNGSDETFTKDAAIYALNGLWPQVEGIDIVVGATTLGVIKAGTTEAYPVRWNPTTLDLVVHAQTRYTYFHPGQPAVQPQLTKDKFQLAKGQFHNWPTAGGFMSSNTVAFSARYLIVAPNAYLPALAEFIAYRKACGYEVTVKDVDAIGSICGNIRGAIDAWYQLGNPAFDHYCLLIGDVDKIPFCPSPLIDSKKGDDLYGSPSGVGDLDEEVFVGRLSVDSVGDLQAQIAKILAYEKGAVQNPNYKRAVLVAHAEDAPGKYQGNCDDVASASYAVAPAFTKIYGSVAGNSNQTIINAIQQGYGLITYRGHGTSSTWSSWNGQNFHKNDVLDIASHHPAVVWSFSCTNSNGDHGSNGVDSIGEVWMEHPGSAVAAHYGSTQTSGTIQNHRLNEAMHKAIFDLGILTHSHAIAYAETVMKDAYPSGQNAWMYMLNGDPAMKVRRKNPDPLGLVLPPEIPTCVGPNCTFVIQVNQGGVPKPGVLVSLYKVASPLVGGGDEILWNGYTGTAGTVVVPLGPQTLGTVNVIGRDDDGNVAVGKIAVGDGVWTDLGDGKAGSNGTPVLHGTGSLQPNTPAGIDLFHAAANSPAVLFVSLSDNPTPLLGGILHAVPVAIQLSVMTDNSGYFSIPIGMWPPTIPSGTKLFLQYAISDPGAWLSVSLSNALKAQVP